MEFGRYLQLVHIVLLLHISGLTSADSSDRCNKDLKHLKYEYHGTKTIYEDARKYLKKTDDDELPKPFDDDSLEKEDRELRDDSCTPLALYFVGRHSARFPDAEDIEQYNKDLYELIEKIKSNEICSRRRQELLSWRSKMTPRHDNLITELGAREERNIARRFKRIYPEFFDTTKAKVVIGVTQKWRTAQTGANFLQEVDGLDLPHCDNKTLPTDDVDRLGYSLDRVLNATCYRQMIDNYEKPFLEFHKQCDKIAGGNRKIRDPRIDRVKNPQLLQRIADRVAEKLGLDNRVDKPPVTPTVLESIYNMCKFENAMRDDSVWCNLFEKKDVKALEYIEDVNSYFKSAYGPQAKPQQSCPLVKNLIEEFYSATKMTNDEPKRSYFYFSHADPIKKLLATFEMFRDDESFSESRLRDFERDLKVPKKRHWRTSVITPFSANLAFIMYRCQTSTGKESKYKILATVTEQPVKLGGCKDTDCNSERFFTTYDSFRDCDLNKICAPNQ